MEKGSYNKLILLGFIGNEPSIKNTKVQDKDTIVCNFTVYVERLPYQIAVWDNTARNAYQYLHKSSRVLVEGSITNIHNDSIEIKATKIIYL